MAGKKPTDSQGVEPKSREDRLKAALKANLARRKAQSRARSGQSGMQRKQSVKAGQNKDA